jgi:hypothetical protein
MLGDKEFKAAVSRKFSELQENTQNNSEIHWTN